MAWAPSSFSQGALRVRSGFHPPPPASRPSSTSRASHKVGQCALASRSPHVFLRVPSRAHAHALPTPSPGPHTRIEGTDPREMPIPAPPAIRTSVTHNSRMGPSSPVRAPFAQVFWRRSRPTTSAGRTRRHKAHLKLFLTFGCAYPPSPPRSGACIAWPKEHPPTVFCARRWSKWCCSARKPPWASPAPGLPGLGRAGRGAGPRGRAHETPSRGAVFCGVWSLLGP